MRAAFAARADQSGQSLNAAIVASLTRDLNEEQARGGSALRGVSDLMAAAFTLGAQRAEGDWTNDPLAFVRAASGAIGVLIDSIPEGEHRALALASLESGVLSRIARERMQPEQEKPAAPAAAEPAPAATEPAPLPAEVVAAIARLDQVAEAMQALVEAVRATRKAG